MKESCTAHGARAVLKSARKKARKAAKPLRRKKARNTAKLLRKKEAMRKKVSGTSRSPQSTTLATPAKLPLEQRARPVSITTRRVLRAHPEPASPARRRNSKKGNNDSKRSLQRCASSVYLTGGCSASSVAGFRYSPRQRTAKCRCGAVERPVPPLNAISCPAATFSPSFTLNSERRSAEL